MIRHSLPAVTPEPARVRGAQANMLSFALYLLGSIVCIAGLAWIATLLGAAQVHVTIVAGILFTAAIFAAAAHKRATDPPPA